MTARKENPQKWLLWKGQLLSGIVALDVETVANIDEEHGVPQLVLGSLSDGHETFLFGREDVPAIINLCFPGNNIVGHNIAAFDAPVMLRALDEVHTPEREGTWREQFSEELWSTDLAREVLLETIDQNRMGDSQLLYQLIVLAERGIVPKDGISLEDLALKYLGTLLDKNPEVRLTFGKALVNGRFDPAQLTKAHFDYAAGDAHVQHALYLELEEEARRLTPTHNVLPNALERFGPLSMHIQIKGAFALTLSRRLGFLLDTDLRDAEIDRISHEKEELLPTLVRAGVMRPATEKKGATTDNAALRELLVEEWLRAGHPEAALPRTDKDEISTKRDDWEFLAGSNDVVSAWLSYKRLDSDLKFFTRFEGTHAHPKYDIVKVTGRTSSSGDSLQNLPRRKDNRAREVCVARPGHMLVVVDYTHIELNTLAQACITRFGSSSLAETINRGDDPHTMTATEFFNESPDSEKFKSEGLRQKAKAPNFGVPGGMGAAKLVRYAKSSYGVDMTIEEAEAFIERLQDIYPELRKWRESPQLLDLYAACRQLGVRPSDLLSVFNSCEPEFDGWMWGVIRRIASGTPYYSETGYPYSAAWVEGFWSLVNPTRLPSSLVECKRHRKGSEDFAKWLGLRSCVLLTGRVRGQAWYTAYRNTQFQGLAADGAKLALFALTKAGYRIVAFVHDEIVVEVPVREDYRDIVEEIEQTMVSAMRAVVPDVKVSVESVVSPIWSKRAKTVIADNGRMLPWTDQFNTQAGRT